MKAADYVGVDSKTGEVFYELACTSGAGFRMGVSGPKTSFISCLTLSESSQACKLTTKEESYAVLTPALQASGKACPVKAVSLRRLLAGQERQTTMRSGCASGPGFMLNVSPDLAYKMALDCTKAQGIAGGCKLTDITVAETADAATYTRLAGQAGFPCQVSKYRFIGTDKQNREVVELACADHPDGGVALFDEKGKSTVYDCVRAGALAQECKFSQASLVYPKYDVALSAKGKGKLQGGGRPLHRLLGASRLRGDSLRRRPARLGDRLQLRHRPRLGRADLPPSVQLGIAVPVADKPQGQRGLIDSFVSFSGRGRSDATPPFSCVGSCAGRLVQFTTSGRAWL